MFSATEIHNHYHLPAQDACAECRRRRRITWLALVVLLALAGAGAAFKAFAAPSHEQARAFTDELVKLVDEGFLVMVDPVRKIARAREVNALEARARQVFGRGEIGDPFFRCVQAARYAREYWHGQRELLDGRTVTPHAVNATARAAFIFGESYRLCRDEVDRLDKRVYPPAKIIDATKGATP